MRYALKFILGLVSASLFTCADTSTKNQVCQPESYRCSANIALRCARDGTGWQVDQDCSTTNKVCTSQGCLTCIPKETQCQAEKLLRCNDDGTAFLPEAELVCDVSRGDVCHEGSCINACTLARETRSYVGCEYWAVDLDNAVVRIGSAAAQQFAVVLSNPSPLPAEIQVLVNEAKRGEDPDLREVTKRTVKPQQLEIVLLPAREVDGSPPGEFDTGTGTALTNNAFKIVSTAPIVAYQFNPLSNVGVFSNDASLLIPTPALSANAEVTSGSPYLVIGWPQTIAATGDFRTNFGTSLRSFLTIVGTRNQTNVRIFLNTDILGDGPSGNIPAKKKGELLDLTIDAFQVINLETNGYGPDGDFTGSRIEADKPVAVFSGSEAADVPAPPDLTLRRCCADHLEEQLFPTTTWGRTFIALTTPSRRQSLKEAGARIDVNPQLQEKEYFRLLSTGEFGSVVTNLPPPQNQLSVGNKDAVQIEAVSDFVIEATNPTTVGQFVAGQQEAGVPASMPGGDPSFILLPPVEQFRRDYLFLTPDKYPFDFVLIAAPRGATITLDSRTVKAGCHTETGRKFCCTQNTVGRVRRQGDTNTTEYEAFKCQLSFPKFVEGEGTLESGEQNDGVHRLTADQPIGVVVYGYDAFVSYGYPGGTDLALINIEN